MLLCRRRYCTSQNPCLCHDSSIKQLVLLLKHICGVWITRSGVWITSTTTPPLVIHTPHVSLSIKLCIFHTVPVACAKIFKCNVKKASITHYRVTYSCLQTTYMGLFYIFLKNGSRYSHTTPRYSNTTSQQYSLFTNFQHHSLVAVTWEKSRCKSFR